MKEIKILGVGCAKCKDLAEMTETMAKSLGLEYRLEKIADINEILSAGAMITPALVVDGQIKCAGKLPSEDNLKKYLS